MVTAFDLLDVEPGPARETVLALAALQGGERHVLSEEEPGRIHNERRDLRAWQAPLWLKALFSLGLAPLWGGTPGGYTTYFASDSTPLFVMLAAALARREPEVLATPVTRRDGRMVSLADSVIAACDWIEGHVNADGLVEAVQSNPLALQQVWKDGPTSNFDEHGRMANVLQPMAYLDVQVLAAEALARAADLGLGSPERLRAVARAIRDATIARFWLPERRYFGCAIDRDRQGRPRLLRAVQSNAGWMLATSFFDDLPEPLRQTLVGGIVRMLFSAELLTAGRHSRPRALRPQPALSQLSRKRLAGRHGGDRPRVAPPGPRRARRRARGASARHGQHAGRHLRVPRRRRRRPRGRPAPHGRERRGACSAAP